MELELGLALPNHPPMMMKGLDLNCSYNNNNGLEIEKNECHLDYEVQTKDSNLLLWSGQPNEEEDDQPDKWRTIHGDDENMNDEEEIVGWPPLNSFRKELLHRHHGGGWMANHRGAGRFPAVRNSMYVKVKMEGVAIGRKIDLRLYNSYLALKSALITMFAKYINSEIRDGDYTILYQDKEGDWMLAGDVPWETFVECVQRMVILRNDT